MDKKALIEWLKKKKHSIKAVSCDLWGSPGRLYDSSRGITADKAAILHVKYRVPLSIIFKGAIDAYKAQN